MDSRPYVVIVNPASGHKQGIKVFEQVKPIFASASATLDAQICSGPRDAFRIASELNPTAYRGCCVIGGDGTVHEVVNGLLQRNERVDLPIGMIPAGSGNTLHLHQGLMDSASAVRNILAGNTSPLEVARVTMGTDVVYCVNIVGWGAVAKINQLAEKLRWIGPIRYAMATAVWIVRCKPRLVRLTLDGNTIAENLFLVIGCNTKYTGNGMKLAPKAEIDDGLIDVIVVRAASRLQLFSLFRKVFDGSHVSLDCVGYHQVKRFSVELEDNQPLNLDGEIAGHAPFQVEMMPNALRIFS